MCPKIKVPCRSYGASPVFSRGSIDMPRLRRCGSDTGVPEFFNRLLSGCIWEPMQPCRAAHLARSALSSAAWQLGAKIAFREAASRAADQRGEIYVTDGK